MANYADVTWTGGDTVTEAKLDNMVSNDRAEDAHASGVHLDNNNSIKGAVTGATLYNLIKVNTNDYMEVGESGLEGLIYKIKRGDEEYDAGNSGTSKTINWKNGNYQKITLTGNVTLSFSNVRAGDWILLRVVQDGTGSRTISWPATTKAVEGSIDLADGPSDESWYYIKAVSASEFQVLGQAINLESV